MKKTQVPTPEEHHKRVVKTAVGQRNAEWQRAEQAEMKLGKATDLLTAIVNAYEMEGCDNCGTVDLDTINDARVFLGMGCVGLPH